MMKKLTQDRPESESEPECSMLPRLKPSTACGTIAGTPAFDVAKMLAEERVALADARAATILCLRCISAASLADTRRAEKEVLAEAHEAVIEALRSISRADLAAMVASEMEQACGTLRTTCEARMEEQCNTCTGTCLTRLMI